MRFSLNCALKHTEDPLKPLLHLLINKSTLPLLQSVTDHKIFYAVVLRKIEVLELPYHSLEGNDRCLVLKWCEAFCIIFMWYMYFSDERFNDRK
jgi:hypothetical protein